MFIEKATKTTPAPLVTIQCICCGMEFQAPADGNHEPWFRELDTSVWFGCEGCGCAWPEPPGMTPEQRALVTAQVEAEFPALMNWLQSLR